MDFLEKVLESHGKVLEFHIKSTVATLFTSDSFILNFTTLEDIGCRPMLNPLFSDLI